ncbi:LDH2 family malate/lactate/ureidoglycolate dehydrogenase [Pullulanibacillus pueri]|uniref:Lactate dehydrogenase n=1 Tax=Pullulanibacillus pueri TaxID=1437324 RepID=A0A8J3EME7_9BACL|nr:Ldh family oxidoreductase [Pullulanibacillus pueri]MBM7682587.1 LDH2 family malate/lactate/ureidoglycolate dehydrogenase [Pullulanibacillus pueri]GGH82409.1 lactate dehydrogenase [Pullulanibacillus pueri]
MSHKFNWEKLQTFTEELFKKAGVNAEDAHVIAESLIEANLRGVDSHGVVRSDIYLRRLEAGMIKTKGEMIVESDGPVTLLDGQNHIGAVVGSKALELIIDSTKKHGTAVVGVKGSNHFGTCGYYLLKAVKENIILMVLSNASQTMPPTGGIRPFIGTNPFSVGIPAGKYQPFILDMATSVVARGKIINAAQKGERIPDTWAIDKDGNPTTDAEAALEGSVLPLGGPKGYAISMFIDILSGVLTGAGFGKYVNNMYENWKEPQNVGHFFIGIDISKFMPVSQFKERIDRYFDEIKSEPTAPDVNEILIPGELEQRATQERKKNGIELPLKVEEELRAWGDKFGVDLSAALIETPQTEKN